ncbi:MAG: hypothetical protein PQJ59_08615 [Spirochaetales bacterium]|nr:hypothetical protein [Spirochaetales bacterium]
MKKYILSLIIALLPLTLWAEDSFRFLFAEGDSFSLVSGGIRKDYTVAETDLINLSFKEGDFLITGEGTFLELLCGEILIMVGENSALAADSLNLSQGSLMTLNYGHVHVRMAYSGLGDLWIGSSEMVGRLNGGELGVLLDYDVTQAQPEITTRIYSLQGRVEVMQKQSEPSLVREKRVEYNAPVIIETGEMVMSSSLLKSTTLIPALFDANYSLYWENHPFGQGGEQSQAMVVLPEEDPALLTPEVQDNLELEGGKDWNRTLTTGKSALLAGAAFMSGGALLYMFEEDDLGQALTYFGILNMSFGFGTTTYGLIGQSISRASTE